MTETRTDKQDNLASESGKQKKKETFYITTPIYYPSAKLHIGHSYTTVAADCIARYQRLLGKDVMLLTGMDEHGQKIQDTALARGMEPQAYVDEMAVGIKNLWKLMNISYDKFIRTTDDYHEKTVQAVFQQLYDNGDIYKGFYEGWYCKSCESFWTETQLVDGKCPDCGGEVQKTQEESYFFRLSKYGDRILQLYEEHPEFLKPDRSRHEMINFIESGLEDLAVTRTSFDWGVKVPFDEKHVIYVWVDALVNYISALGYPEDAQGEFAKYWPADIHLIGKEITRFHCIIWPAMLMSLGLELPKKVHAHGWLLLNNSKMSKSKGNVVDPVVLCERYGVDAVRYFLLREVPFGSDGNFSNKALIDRINSDLANDLGNLLSRTTAMVAKYCDGILPPERESTEFDSALKDLANETIKTSGAYLDEMQFSKSLEVIWNLVRRANKYIDETEPWVLAKSAENQARLANVLGNLCEALRITAILIYPFMPATSKAILEDLQLSEEISLAKLSFSVFQNEEKISASKPLFPRLDITEEMEWLEDLNQKQAEQAKAGQSSAADKAAKHKTSDLDSVDSAAQKDLTSETKADSKTEITYAEFEQLDLQVATVKACEKMENADKLLKFDLELKEGEHRTVVSGLAEYYKPEDLIGKQVVLLTNLKPRKIRGVLSEGMILSAQDQDGTLVIVSPETVVDSGSIVA